MRVLIVGGTNFIGPPLVRRLIESGCEVTVFHRGTSLTALPEGVGRILGDRRELARHAGAFRRFGPDVVVDMIAYSERDAVGMLDAFRGVARRSVVISSADVYRAFGRLLGVEPGPVEPTPLDEDAPLRTTSYPYRAGAKGPDDFLYDYSGLPSGGIRE